MLVIETNIDDMNPQYFDHVMERLFAAGARDVFLTPIQMKKNRLATLLTVICEPASAIRSRNYSTRNHQHRRSLLSGQPIILLAREAKK